MVERIVLWSYYNKGILISFWLSYASKTSTYGYDEQGRITSLIDCNGHEVIVVSGETADSDDFHYQFIEAAIKNINDLKEEGVPAENITWMVVETGYKSEDLVNFAATADKLGINYVGISNKEQMIDYINNKDSETARAEDQITYMSFFSHGQCPIYSGSTENQLSFAYGIEGVNRRSSRHRFHTEQYRKA